MKIWCIDKHIHEEKIVMKCVLNFYSYNLSLTQVAMSSHSYKTVFSHEN